MQLPSTVLDLKHPSSHGSSTTLTGHYFATNWKGNTRDAKSYADLMRIRRILLSYPLDSKNPEGAKKFQVGRGPKATVKEAPASDTMPTDLTPEEQEIILENKFVPSCLIIRLEGCPAIAGSSLFCAFCTLFTSFT